MLEKEQKKKKLNYSTLRLRFSVANIGIGSEFCSSLSLLAFISIQSNRALLAFRRIEQKGK